mgnify:CR=1 FL=1
MNKNIKYIVTFIGIGAAVFFIIYGAYMPFQEASLYISALRKMSSIRSVQDFEANFNRVFDFYSPVGEEEIVKFLSYDILGVISQGGQSESVAREVVSYIEPHLFKNNVRHLLNGAHMYEILWRNFGKKDEDFKKAEEYYLAARAIGPKLPPVLYSLVGLYQQKGDFAKAKDVAEAILKLWPQDTRVTQFLSILQEQQ